MDDNTILHHLAALCRSGFWYFFRPLAAEYEYSSLYCEYIQNISFSLIGHLQVHNIQIIIRELLLLWVLWVCNVH
jgi:hypothetical protein